MVHKARIGEAHGGGGMGMALYWYGAGKAKAGALHPFLGIVAVREDAS